MRNELVLLTLLLPAIGSAQTGSGVLAGQILAEDATPLAQARIRVIGATLFALSGDDGKFTLGPISAGDQVLDVRRLGYVAFVQLVKIPSGQTLTVQLTMVAAPVPLKAVEVKGEADDLLPAMRGFEQRRARGNGRFFSRTEIARMQPRAFTDILRRVPGVQLQSASGAFGGNEMVTMARTTGIMGARRCPVLFYVNGMPVQITGELSIDQYVPPEDVIAIEVYSGTSQIPPEFQSNLLNSRCGVIVIWTRVGNETDDQPQPPAPPPPPPPPPRPPAPPPAPPPPTL